MFYVEYYDGECWNRVKDAYTSKEDAIVCLEKIYNLTNSYYDVRVIDSLRACTVYARWRNRW